MGSELPDVPHYNRLQPAPIYVMNMYNLSCNLAPALKYLSRLGHKDSELKELNKVIDYLNFELDYGTQVYEDSNHVNVLKRPVTYIDNKPNPSKLLIDWDCKYKDFIINILEAVTTPKVEGVMELLVLRDNAFSSNFFSINVISGLLDPNINIPLELDC